MFSEGDSEQNSMDNPEASSRNIREIALVGRVVKWDTLPSKEWITNDSDDGQVYRSLSHTLWAKTVYVLHDW